MTSLQLLKATWRKNNKYLIRDRRKQDFSNGAKCPPSRAQVSVCSSLPAQTPHETGGPRTGPQILITCVSSVLDPHYPTPPTNQQQKQLQERPSPQYKYSAVTPSPPPPSPHLLLLLSLQNPNLCSSQRPT